MYVNIYIYIGNPSLSFLRSSSPSYFFLLLLSLPLSLYPPSPSVPPPL